MRDRLAILKQRARDISRGGKPVGVVKIGDGGKYARGVLDERWQADRAGRLEDKRLDAHATCFGPEDKILCAATSWQKDVDGWKTVDCLLDSGASESVCPASMAPAWPVEDSPGSLVGLNYLTASGSRIPNRGQQRLPIELGDGTRTHSIFQVADVSRPLVSVARLAEAGKAVIFGCSGGVIRDMTSGGDIPFERRDGIYIFKMKMPPPSAVSPTSSFARYP